MTCPQYPIVVPVKGKISCEDFDTNFQVIKAFVDAFCNLQEILDEIETAKVLAVNAAADAQTSATNAQAALVAIQLIQIDLQPLVNALTELLALESALPELLNLEGSLAEILAVEAALAQVVTVANNIANVITVSGAVTEITALANNLAALLNIEASLTQILNVNASLVQILAVEAALTQIQAVFNNLAEILTVEANIGDIVICANNIAAIIAAPTEALNAANSAAAAQAAANSILPQTGTLPVTYDVSYIYGDAGTPLTGNITDDQTGAVVGLVQKLYHQDASIPTFPATYVNIGAVGYVVNELNIIYIEYVSATRIEYWIAFEL
jgi:chorismate-pyruvate lyase